MTEFGRLLTDQRMARGVTQYRLAVRVDCHPSSIQRIERGTRVPSRDFMERIIAALSLDTREGNAFRLAAGFAPVSTKGVRT
jgi:transcriptional regulator with XRE-family HTH domain